MGTSVRKSKAGNIPKGRICILQLKIRFDFKNFFLVNRYFKNNHFGKKANSNLRINQRGWARGFSNTEFYLHIFL